MTMGLKAGDHLVVVMRNRYEMATLYWASHLIGIIFTPVSWRASADEINYCLEDAEARGDRLRRRIRRYGGQKRRRAQDRPGE